MLSALNGLIFSDGSGQVAGGISMGFQLYAANFGPGSAFGFWMFLENPAVRSKFLWKYMCTQQISVQGRRLGCEFS